MASSADSTLTCIPIIDNFVAPPCHEKIKILYQDEHVLVIDKPTGLLSLSGKNPANWDSVHYRLVNGQPGLTPPFAEAKLAHRLDLGTSGAMLVSLTAQASSQLNKQFQTRSIHKTYLALLNGWLSEDKGIIKASIAKDKAIFPRVKICPSSGKPAQSLFRVLQRFTEPRSSLVEFNPLTGRTHQLRIHSLHIGHPIIGCDLYSTGHSQQLADRLLLHASKLSFSHPINGKQITIQCPAPF